MTQTFISIDVEADGPIPGPYSMLAIGAVALDGETGNELDHFYANLLALPGAGQHPKTMEFWAKNPKAWERVMRDREHPVSVMQRFVRWLHGFPEPVFVGYPAGYDWMWTYWYLIRFTYGSPFGHSAMIDIKTLMWVGSGKGRFRDVAKRTLSRSHPRWFQGAGRHSHDALDDALEQAVLFLRVSDSVTDEATAYQQATLSLTPVSRGSESVTEAIP